MVMTRHLVSHTIFVLLQPCSYLVCNQALAFIPFKSDLQSQLNGGASSLVYKYRFCWGCQVVAESA